MSEPELSEPELSEPELSEQDLADPGLNDQEESRPNPLGLDGQVFDALQRGDFQAAIFSLLAEKCSDPLLAVAINLMFAGNHVAPATGEGAIEHDPGPPKMSDWATSDLSGTAMWDPSQAGQLDTARAGLQRVTRMLGACSTCCGEEASCPDCNGGGKPGSEPSTVSAEELREWLEPLLSPMGMQITTSALADAPFNR